MSLFNRTLQLQTFYVNEGLLPNHAVLWRPYKPYELSFFLCLSNTQEALAGFAVCFVAFSALLVGYKTRLAQVASFLCAMSLRNRLPWLLNAGDIVLGLLAFWTLFLPVNRRYSVDAALTQRDEPNASATTINSLAALALFVQVAVIYTLNYVQKTGETWASGSALHYVLHQDRLVTSFGVWLRENLSAGQLAAITKSTLVIEAILPVCVLSPVATVHLRRIAAGLIFVLHLGFGLCLNLGVFVPAMLVFGIILVPGKDWDRIARRLPNVFVWIAQFARTPFTARTDRPVVRETLVAGAILLATYQVLSENTWFSRFKPPESQVLSAAVTYLGLYQGWSLFAPDAPKTDLNITVDATTVDGRHIDPISLVASTNHKPGLQIPPHLGQAWLWDTYIGHVHSLQHFNPMLVDWIGRHHLRTGIAADRVVLFDAYIVEDDSPSPGELHPSNTRWERFIRHSFE